MEEFVKQLAEKVGIDRGTAEKVAGFLQQNAANLPTMLSGDAQALAAPLSKLGIDSAHVQRIITFLREHAADLPKWLGEQGGGILQKAKDALGGILGGGKETK
jgi:hypothetical protein